jgi:hypothetical protein
LSGTSSIDSDGIPASIEDLTPNFGDGNNDGDLDSVQDNVLSIQTSDGGYLTFVIDEASDFTDFSLLEESQLIDPPPDMNINNAFRFSLENLPFIFGVSPVEIGLILPAGVVPNTFYMYGPTPDDSNPHWYEFMFDGITGAQIFGNVNIELPSGVVIQRSVVKLVLVDGFTGDSDLTVNGVISVQGSYTAPVPVPDSNGGIINPFALLLLLFYRLYSAISKK